MVDSASRCAVMQTRLHPQGGLSWVAGEVGGDDIFLRELDEEHGGGVAAALAECEPDAAGDGIELVGGVQGAAGAGVGVDDADVAGGEGVAAGMRGGVRLVAVEEEDGKDEQ